MSFRMRIDMRSREYPEGNLQISGRLVGAWVAEFETACTRRLQAGMQLTVDLSELTFVDAAGIDAVNRFAIEGVEFSGGSAFIRRRLGLPVA